MILALPRGKTRFILPAAAAALALIAALFAFWPVSAQTSNDGRPLLNGGVSIVNLSQPAGSLLGVGDSIWFRVNVTKPLEQVQVTPALAEANHFHFRYHRLGDPRKAKLAAVASDGSGTYLLYRHVVLAGDYTNTGILYFADTPAPAVSADLKSADGSGQFNFRLAPANNFALSGKVKVASGGSALTRLPRPVANIPADLSVLNAPASGWHRPGDKITLRLSYSTRLAVPDTLGWKKLRFLVRPNSTALADNEPAFREAALSGVGNAGNTGYADFVYTVQDGDQDLDGIKLWNFLYSTMERLCPESQGLGCAEQKTSQENFPDGGHVVSGVRTVGPDLVWADVPKNEITFAQTVNYPLTGGYSAVGSVTGTISGYPVFYSAGSNLPTGLKLGQSNGAAVIYGTPSVTSTARNVVITAEDTTGRKASHTVTLDVEAFVPVSLPSNSDGGYNVTVYTLSHLSGGSNYGGGMLPAAMGSDPVTYTLTNRNGGPLGSCVSYNGDSSTPGFVTFNPVRQCQSDGRAWDGVSAGDDGVISLTEQLRFTATGPDGAKAQLDFAFKIINDRNPSERSGVVVVNNRHSDDLDLDNDGLIEITTAEQLMAIRFDVDGDGAPAHSGHSWFYFYDTNSTPGGFRSQLNAATGCPESGCVGYELSNDIDLGRLNASWQGSGYFRNLSRPLDGYGNDLSGPWNAIFEGNGYTISGVNFQQPGRRYMGLFEEIASGGVVRNLGLVSPSLRGELVVGAFAGINYGTIQNVYVLDGTVVADFSNAGLLVGYNYGTIRSFWATGSVTAPAAAGSLAGGNYGSGSISDGWTDGFTEATIPLGGTQGFNYLLGHSTAGTSFSFAWEIDARANYGQGGWNVSLVTDDDLRVTTGSSGKAQGLLDAVWDFGDNCQRPVLKSGSHSPAKQSEVRGSACASSE